MSRPDRIFRKLPVGPNADPLIFAIFACFETLLAAVYTGVGERALALGVEAVQRRTSFKNGGRSYAQDPDIRWKIAEAAMAMDALYPQLSPSAGDVDDLADHGAQWFPRLVGLKVRATETARTVVDLAIRVIRRLQLLPRFRTGTALPRRAGRDVPPLRRRISPQHRRQRLAGPARTA